MALRFRLLALSSLVLGACHPAGTTSRVADVDDGGSFLTEDQIIESLQAQETAGDARDAVYDAAADAGDDDDDAPVFVDLTDLIDGETPLSASDDPSLQLRDDDDRAATTGDVDITAYDSTPKNQGQRGWCTSFATVGAMENLAKQRGQDLNLSEIHLWKQYQRYRTAAALKAATTTYVVPETVWPYTAAQATGDLDANGLVELTSYQQIKTGYRSVAGALQANHPVVFAIGISNKFSDGWKNHKGVIASGGSATRYGHAILVTGVHFSSSVAGGGYFTLKNSWGTKRGDHGYAYLPFKYCANFSCYAWEVSDIDIKGSAPSTPATEDRSVRVNVNYGAMDGKNKTFNLSLDPNTIDLTQVDKVVYDSHPTFGASEFSTVTDASSNFASIEWSTYSHSWTTRATKIYMKDGSVKVVPGVAISW